MPSHVHAYVCVWWISNGHFMFDSWLSSKWADLKPTGRACFNSNPIFIFSFSYGRQQLPHATADLFSALSHRPQLMWRQTHHVTVNATNYMCWHLQDGCAGEYNSQCCALFLWTYQNKWWNKIQWKNVHIKSLASRYERVVERLTTINPPQSSLTSFTALQMWAHSHYAQFWFLTAAH